MPSQQTERFSPLTIIIATSFCGFCAIIVLAGLKETGAVNQIQGGLIGIAILAACTAGNLWAALKSRGCSPIKAPSRAPARMAWFMTEVVRQSRKHPKSFLVAAISSALLEIIILNWYAPSIHPDMIAVAIVLAAISITFVCTYFRRW